MKKEKSIYDLIGRQIEKRNRRYFEELKDSIGYRKPVLSDLSALPRVVGTFCDCKGIDPARLREKSYDRNASHARELCLAVLLLIYCPNSMNPKIQSVVERAFKTHVSTMLNTSYKKMGAKMKKVPFLYLHDRSFRTEVDDLCQKITSKLYANHTLERPLP